MSSLLDNLVNPQSLEGLYAEGPPLTEFELISLRLEERGPSFFLSGEFSAFPDTPRPQWEADAFALQIELTLSMVEHFEVSGRMTEAVVDLQIARGEDGFSVELGGESEDFSFFVRGMSLQIVGLNALVAGVRFNR